MFQSLATGWLRWIGGRPAFRVYGKARRERDWRVLDVFASRRRNLDSRWPAFLWRGTSIAWTSSVIAVGWDLAEELVREQAAAPASRAQPLEVAGGRLRDLPRRREAGGPVFAGAGEVLAHEIGHTWQARRLSLAYWPVGAAVTLFREGPHWWNHFENQASEQGLFGGLVPGSVCPRLAALRRPEVSRSAAAAPSA
jgi:hypothetical protein